MRKNWKAIFSGFKYARIYKFKLANGRTRVKMYAVQKGSPDLLTFAGRLQDAGYPVESVVVGGVMCRTVSFTAYLPPL